MLYLFLQSSPCRLSEGELVELNGLMEYMSAQIMNTILILFVLKQQDILCQSKSDPPCSLWNDSCCVQTERQGKA